MASKTSEAIVRRSVVAPKLNESLGLTFQSDRLPLSACFWAHSVRGERQLVALQGGIDHDPVDGVEYFSDKLSGCKCGVSISSVKDDLYGPWSCTLVASEGQVLAGKVDVLKGNLFQLRISRRLLQARLLP